MDSEFLGMGSCIQVLPELIFLELYGLFRKYSCWMLFMSIRDKATPVLII